MLQDMQQKIFCLALAEKASFSFGEILCRVRPLPQAIRLILADKRKGLSQERPAEKPGIGRQHLTSIGAPNMSRGLSLELLFNIATVLEIELYLLLKFSPEK